MARIDGAQAARSIARRLLEEALDDLNAAASGDRPRARTVSEVARSLLALADSMEADEE